MKQSVEYGGSLFFLMNAKSLLEYDTIRKMSKDIVSAMVLSGSILGYQNEYILEDCELIIGAALYNAMYKTHELPSAEDIHTVQSFSENLRFDLGILHVERKWVKRLIIKQFTQKVQIAIRVETITGQQCLKLPQTENLYDIISPKDQNLRRFVFQDAVPEIDFMQFSIKLCEEISENDVIRGVNQLKLADDCVVNFVRSQDRFLVIARPFQNSYENGILFRKHMVAFSVDFQRYLTTLNVAIPHRQN